MCCRSSLGRSHAVKFVLTTPGACGFFSVKKQENAAAALLTCPCAPCAAGDCAGEQVRERVPGKDHHTGKGLNRGPHSVAGGLSAESGALDCGEAPALSWLLHVQELSYAKAELQDTKAFISDHRKTWLEIAKQRDEALERMQARAPRRALSLTCVGWLRWCRDARAALVTPLTRPCARAGVARGYRHVGASIGVLADEV